MKRQQVESHSRNPLNAEVGQQAAQSASEGPLTASRNSSWLHSDTALAWLRCCSQTAAHPSQVHAHSCTCIPLAPSKRQRVLAILMPAWGPSYTPPTCQRLQQGIRQQRKRHTPITHTSGRKDKTVGGVQRGEACANALHKRVTAAKSSFVCRTL